MTHVTWRFPFKKRGRRRASRYREDPSAVFKTFVQVLTQMHAQTRASDQLHLGAHPEKS
ncbi:histidine kinase [Methylocystis sp. WRRC1]|uniref:histidine kinase n=1 Tax=Methylocystis sp. WRRC1 TaxID=1732014 RepID=UPI001D159B52|nr:histidine kinase [Methylocystis sp. WRRC1]MCC3244679.1 histidine kinase [Methylocystis sp. WRRC1]